jgi:hypothetical protein
MKSRKKVSEASHLKCGRADLGPNPEPAYRCSVDYSDPLNLMGVGKSRADPRLYFNLGCCNPIELHQQ